jgi:heme exporter protein D
MNRLTRALIAYAALGILTWLTISDSRIRGVTLLILALFAVKSVLRRKDVLHPDESSDDAEG